MSIYSFCLKQLIQKVVDMQRNIGMYCNKSFNFFSEKLQFSSEEMIISYCNECGD